MQLYKSHKSMQASQLHQFLALSAIVNRAHKSQLTHYSCILPHRVVMESFLCSHKRLVFSVQDMRPLQMISCNLLSCTIFLRGYALIVSMINSFCQHDARAHGKLKVGHAILNHIPSDDMVNPDAIIIFEPVLQYRFAHLYTVHYTVYHYTLHYTSLFLTAILLIFLLLLQL